MVLTTANDFLMVEKKLFHIKLPDSRSAGFQKTLKKIGSDPIEKFSPCQGPGFISVL
jgi:hypothetical protein